MFDDRDTERLRRTLDALAGAGLRGFAVTGGAAAVLHGVRDGAAPRLNDLDLVVAQQAPFPEALGREFLVNHFHPAAAAGKLRIQLVDPRTALRIDMFGAIGGTIGRAARCGEFAWPLVACEDLACRALLSTLPILDGRSVEAKPWRDLDRLVAHVDRAAVEHAWREHRRDDVPAGFTDAAAAVLAAGRSERGRLVDPVYSTDPSQGCGRCTEDPRFPLAPRATILAILGYC